MRDPRLSSGGAHTSLSPRRTENEEKLVRWYKKKKDCSERQKALVRFLCSRRGIRFSKSLPTLPNTFILNPPTGSSTRIMTRRMLQFLSKKCTTSWRQKIGASEHSCVPSSTNCRITFHPSVRRRETSPSTQQPPIDKRKKTTRRFSH